MIRYFAVFTVFASMACNHAAGATITAFYDDFDGGQTIHPGISGGFSGVISTTAVQGYAGFGTTTNLFANNFLRNATGGRLGGGGMDGVPGDPTILTLANLPAHSSFDLNFLLGILDSWTGVAGPPGDVDVFNVVIDGTSFFSEIFDNHTGGVGQSYVSPPGVFLTRSDLGFNTTHSGFWDAAYDMGLDSQFDNIPHSSNTLTIKWFASGTGWEGGVNESWAIENVEVVLNGVITDPTVVPEPSTFALAALALIPLLFYPARRRRLRAA